MVTVDSKVTTSKIIHCELGVKLCLKTRVLCLEGVKSSSPLSNGDTIELICSIKNGWILFGFSKELTEYDDSKTPCSIKIVLLRRKPYFSVTSVTPCSVWLPQLQLVLSIMPLILRDFIKIIRYTGECSIFSAYQRLYKATQTFEICTWYCILEKFSF